MAVPTSRRYRTWLVVSRRQSQAGRLGLEVLALAVVGLLPGVLTLVSALAVAVGFITPFVSVTEGSRQLADQYRRNIEAWTGIAIDDPYLPRAAPPEPNGEGRYQLGLLLRRKVFTSYEMAVQMQHAGRLIQDPATWRDLAWLLLNPLVALALFAVPIAVGLYGLAALAGSAVAVLLFGATRPAPTGLAETFWHPTAALGGLVWLAIPAGLLLIGAYLATTWWSLRCHGRWSAWLLRPTARARLAQRVHELTVTRTHATDTGAAELRRIERDLHDGAQARMVAVGITLRTAERVLDDDPATARRLVAEARATSAAALRDLRALVRGIHPPVLAERGLVDAVRAVALDTPVGVAVHADVPGEPEPPVAAAVYFAVCELLANAAKHAHPARIDITMTHSGGVLRVLLRDDGRGGADPASGSGLRGVTQRLATFDGTLVIDSPAGGPTTATLELPCALSSPRTSTSSEPG